MCMSNIGSSSLTYLSGIIDGRPKVILRVLRKGKSDGASKLQRSLLTDQEGCSRTKRAYEFPIPVEKIQNSFLVNAGQVAKQLL